MYQPFLPLDLRAPERPPESRGVIYTRRWVVDLILDLAGYREETNLVDALAIEPAAGEGAFLIPMACRLVASCRRQGRPYQDCASALVAYEIDKGSTEKARTALITALVDDGIESDVAESLAEGWIKVGDYLMKPPRPDRADFIVGNPPYVRLEDLPDATAQFYRVAFPTMRGRADLYVAFYEASLRQLKDSGVCVFICADRWMLNQYGSELRRLVTDRFSVETIIEMHDTNAFDEQVSAYPAITSIRRGPQGRAVVASLRNSADTADPREILATLQGPSPGRAGLVKAEVESWFSGPEPWPCSSPGRLAILRRLEERFEPLESAQTKVGIGVATGNDAVFITKARPPVEPSRLLPIALASDTSSGQLEWSGHHLIDPWDEQGLVNLSEYPLLRDYLEKHREILEKRHTAKKNPRGWYRTIDRVNHRLTTSPKLYIPDIKDRLNPVLDNGRTYPHHNLYFIQSDVWDLEVLGGLLLSAVGQFFVEVYGVRMRGGYLRFQAQYLRRIRVPNPRSIGPDESARLIRAFRERDRKLATEVAYHLYGIDALEFDDAPGS